MQLFGTQVLQTNRITLRQFNVNDINNSFINWASDSNMCAYLTWKAHSNLEVTHQILTNWIKNYSDQNFLQWAIVINDCNQVIGTISVVNIDINLETVELGYCIGSSFWHHGYGSEACGLVIDYLFTQCHVNRIVAKHSLDNIRSGNVMLRCGMHYEGKSYHSYKNNQGQYIDMVHYGLTKLQFITNKRFDIFKSQEEILSNCQSLLSDDYVLSNLSNLVSYLFEKITHLNWIGYYFLINDELVLGPFQGKVACNPLSLSKGICAKCATSKQVTVVNDVHQVSDHIACDSASNAELVLPIFYDNILIGVLDIDSPIKNRFDEATVQLFIKITELINAYMKNHH